MAGSLQNRVQIYTGTLSDTTNLTDLLNAGIRSVINAIPESKLEKYSTALTDSGLGVDISSSRVFKAHKGGYKARKVDSGIKVQVLPSGALQTISIVNGGTGYTLNDVLTLTTGGTLGTCKVTSVNATVVTGVEILTNGSSYSLGVSATTVAPAGGTNCTLYVIPTNGSIHQATSTDPVWYIENTKGYVIPSGGTLIGVNHPSGITYSSTSISTFPAEWEQAVILWTAIQELMFKTNVTYDAITSLTLDTITAPNSPSVTTFNFVSANYTDATYSSSSFIPATIDITSATTIGTLPTSPIYTAPTCSLIVPPADLSILSTPPSTPALPTYSYVEAILGNYTSTSITDFGTAPTYTKPVTSANFTNTNTYIGTAQDLEKAQVEITQQQSILDMYSKDINTELYKYNSSLESYKSTIQKNIRQAELDQERLMISATKASDISLQNKVQMINASISLYKDTLQKYAEDLNLYQATVNKETQAYRTNLEKWTVDRQTQLSLYSNDIQNATALFNKELAVYQAGIQKLIEQARLDQERLINQSSKIVELNKFNEAKAIETALQNNQQNAIVSIQNKNKAAEIDILNKTKTLEASIESYRANLQLYEMQIQSYGQDINKAVQKYSLGIQKSLGQLQSVNNMIEQCRKEFQTIMSLI